MAALTKEQVKQLFETLENPIDRNDENEFIKSAELGIKYPIPTPINIAKKIQSVK